MSLKPRPAVDPDAAPEIPALADDPRFAAASRVLRVLRDASERIASEIDLLELEEHFAALPRQQAATPRNGILRDRLEVRRREAAAAPRADQEAPPDLGTPETVARALQLIREGSASKPPGRAKRLAVLRESREIVGEALLEQGSVVEAIRQEISVDLCRRLQAHHGALILEAFNYAVALAAAVDRERSFRASILTAGYTIDPQIISPPPLRSLLMLGSEGNVQSEISVWRRLLEQNGVLPR
ncbi:MAG: hypothetical protein KGL52_14060 [Rhodospirillales bacterium]|nr:hypothetical protein [Rhodospirillales bacterium]